MFLHTPSVLLTDFAIEEDFGEMARIYQESFSYNSVAKMQDSLSTHARKPFTGFLKHWHENHVDGFLGFRDSIDTPFIEVTHLYIRKDRKRKGIATSLMDDFAQFAQIIGKKKITLESSAEGLAFYENLGFTIVQTYAFANVKDYMTRVHQRRKALSHS